MNDSEKTGLFERVWSPSCSAVCKETMETQWSARNSASMAAASKKKLEEWKRCGARRERKERERVRRRRGRGAGSECPVAETACFIGVSRETNRHDQNKACSFLSPSGTRGAGVRLQRLQASQKHFLQKEDRAVYLCFLKT